MELLSITIASTLQAVGILLVNSLFVIPASARSICQQFVPYLAIATGIGALSRLMEMVISDAIDLISRRVLF